MNVLGIDIGGSGIKGAPVDLSMGALTAKRHRIPTPPSRSPFAILEAVSAIAEHHDWDGPIGVAFPGVVVDGVIHSAANLSDDWINYPARKVLSDALGVEVSVVNDADAAGIAEVAYGAARNEPGVVLVLTFGTGIGSALINDGALVPNSELGHLEFNGMEAEHYAAARLVEDGGMGLTQWAARVDEFLAHVDSLFSPRLIVFGGGISKRFSEYESMLTARVRVVPAELRNNAGIVGAAMRSESEPS